jgi:hypothetical protein
MDLFAALPTRPIEVDPDLIPDEISGRTWLYTDPATAAFLEGQDVQVFKAPDDHKRRAGMPIAQAESIRLLCLRIAMMRYIARVEAVFTPNLSSPGRIILNDGMKRWMQHPLTHKWLRLVEPDEWAHWQQCGALSSEAVGSNVRGFYAFDWAAAFKRVAEEPEWWTYVEGCAALVTTEQSTASDELQMLAKDFEARPLLAAARLLPLRLEMLE